jgi:hypothetical protein
MDSVELVVSSGQQLCPFCNLARRVFLMLWRLLSVMNSEVFLRDDVQAILNALVQAQNDFAMRAPNDQAAAYNDGFSAALRAVATALHIRLAEQPPSFHLAVRTMTDPNWCQRADVKALPRLSSG